MYRTGSHHNSDRICWCWERGGLGAWRPDWKRHLYHSTESARTLARELGRQSKQTTCGSVGADRVITKTRSGQDSSESETRPWVP